MLINNAEIIKAIAAARKGRAKRKDFRITPNDAETFRAAIAEGTYLQHIAYRRLQKRNNNGKIRSILQPNHYTLVLQHICKLLLQPYYDAHDNHVGLNCKKGCGISTRNRKTSVNKRLKHIFFDCRNLNYSLIIDQRQCYAHITQRTVRRALKAIKVPRELIDFTINVSFVEREFPIGTPTSPLIHHIVMLSTDKLLAQLSSRTVRYADDCFLAFETKEDAQRAKWRIKNLWWYELLIRAKRHNLRIQPLTEPTDFCGNVYFRNENKRITDHNKGYARVRQAIAERAMRCNDNNYPSYFGLLKAVDGFNFLIKLEKDLKLSQLTNKIRIHRSDLDAQEIAIEDLHSKEQVFSIEDYEIRRDKNGKPNWIRCLITLPPEEGKIEQEARSFYGGYSSIALYIDKCETHLAKEEFLPLEDCVIDKLNGYYLRGSLELIVAKLNGKFITN